MPLIRGCTNSIAFEDKKSLSWWGAFCIKHENHSGFCVIYKDDKIVELSIGFLTKLRLNNELSTAQYERLLERYERQGNTTTGPGDGPTESTCS